MGFGLLGVAGPTLSATPKSPKPFFFFFLAFSGGRTTPWPKMGWPGHPILEKEVAGATPDFHLFFFFFFLDFLFFFNNNNNAQNDVVLGWVLGVVLEPRAKLAF
jgi:hypothetical protein